MKGAYQVLSPSNEAIEAAVIYYAIKANPELAVSALKKMIENKQITRERRKRLAQCNFEEALAMYDQRTGKPHPFDNDVWEALIGNKAA